MGCKQSKTDKVQTQGKKLAPKGWHLNHKRALAHACSTARTAVVVTLVHRTKRPGKEHPESYCTEAAGEAWRVSGRIWDDKEGAV